jgi:hypothetical protein
MSSVEKLVAVGEKFGLVGKVLMDWVTEKQKEERAEREAARMAEKEKADLEKQRVDSQMSLEKEKAEEQRRLEREKVDLERQRLDFQIELEKQRVDSQIRLEKEKAEDQIRLETIALERARIEKESKVLACQLAKIESNRQGSTGEENAMADSENEAAGGDLGTRRGLKGPRMPPFEEGKDG